MDVSVEQPRDNNPEAVRASELEAIIYCCLPDKSCVRALSRSVVVLASVAFCCGFLAERDLMGAEPLVGIGNDGQAFDHRRAAEVSVEFGATNRESGLHVIAVADSKHTPARLDGRDVRFFKRGWNYAYFAIDPAFKQSLGTDVVIRAEYQILGRDPIGAQYDGHRGAYSSAIDIQRDYKEPNSNWRVIEFRAQDARLRNSQNGGADFRIYDNEQGFYLRRVSLMRYPGKRILLRNLTTGSNLVDLTKFYNASLRFYMPGGDLDMATNVISEIRLTTGVDFDLRGYIGLLRRGEEPGRTNTTPEAVTGIPIGRRLKRMHFLHGSAYGEKENEQIGSYIIHMSDGSIEDLSIVYGRNVRSERGDYRKLPEAEVAWEGEGLKTGAGRRVRMFKVTWDNPSPALEITKIDFISAVSRSAPHLLAITIDP